MRFPARSTTAMSALGVRAETGASAASGARTTDAAPATTAPGGVRITGLAKAYERVVGRELVRTHALRDVSMEVRPQEFVSIIGPSGCGKSTVLRIVGGLTGPSAGVVEVGGARVTGPGADRATVFQSPGLMPWRTVRDNVTLALEFAGVPKRERRARADTYIDLVGLHDFAEHHPRELSGGMQQRVGLARALAVEPTVLLMDEPFGALDAMTRDVLHDELERLWRETGLSVIFVTHNVREAVRLGDRVILLSSRPGRIVEEYTIGIDRPRRLDSTEVAEQARVITDRLKEEVRRHGR